jgi:hypothetical protein
MVHAPDATERGADAARRFSPCRECTRGLRVLIELTFSRRGPINGMAAVMTVGER